MLQHAGSHNLYNLQVPPPVFDDFIDQVSSYIWAKQFYFVDWSPTNILARFETKSKIQKWPKIHVPHIQKSQTRIFPMLPRKLRKLMINVPGPCIQKPDQIRRQSRPPPAPNFWGCDETWHARFFQKVPNEHVSLAAENIWGSVCSVILSLTRGWNLICNKRVQFLANWLESTRK